MVLPAHAREGHRVQKTAVVNWDPVDQTVLANEQVIDGRGWRSGAPVESTDPSLPAHHRLRRAPRVSRQAARLAERVKVMQANWIGKSVGVRFAFTHDIRDETGTLIGDGRMYVLRRAPTIMGVTFCAVAPSTRSPRTREVESEACRVHRGMLAAA
jgi:leucyl-tRNA synthetase